MAEPVPAGSDVSAGTYRCTNCGNELQVSSTTHLPPCPSCSNGEYETVSGGDAAADPYPGIELMADLTPLDEKLGEVLGLAQAAQAAAEKVSGMEGAEDFQADLRRMQEQAAETEQRTDALVDGLEGKKTAIREKARDTKGEATEMMQTYLGGEDEALDGFEFLSMAEAGELCHWEIVEKMAGTIAAGDVEELAAWAVGIQREHVEKVRRASLQLAAEEIEEATGA